MDDIENSNYTRWIFVEWFVAFWGDNQFFWDGITEATLEKWSNIWKINNWILNFFNISN
jgi:hypothetical protein